LVRDGSVLPHIQLAQCTDEMYWSQIELKIYAVDAKEATGLLCLPSDNQLHALNVAVKSHQIKADGLENKVKFKVSR